MFAKRLVRLLLAPGALAYTLLAFVVGLIWLGVGTPATPPTPRAAADPSEESSAVTYRGDVGEDAPLIAPQEAIESARRFAGEPGMMLEGGLQTDPSGTRRVDFYYLESLGPTRGEDFFKIDARTAEVIEATFRSRLAATNPPIDLGLEEAGQAASLFARQRFYGFDALSLVDRSSRAAERNVVHSFKWSEIAADSGAELPVSVSVAVSGGSGEVVWYLAQRDQLLVDVHPAIERARAIQVATRSLGSRDTRWDTTRPSAVRLQVMYDDDDQQQLVWSVTFRSRQQEARPTLRLLVNAHTGQILASPS